MRLRVRSLLPLVLPLAGAAITGAACYPAAGEGVDPPVLNFYFPVGFAVSKGGNVLYAVNSDFDLQWNGGTIQSLDLHLIRRHAVTAIADPTNPNLPLALGVDPNASCPNGPPVVTPVNDAGVEPGWACAPPTNASFYIRDSVAIGAFATDLQVSVVNDPQDASKSRLFSSIRGDASLTWAEVVNDDPNSAPSATDTVDTYAPFQLDCGTRDAHRRCDRAHRVGNDPNQLGDTRNLTMPGEPFGMAQSTDGKAIVMTSQTATQSTVLTSFTQGINIPALQFVLDGLPVGGVGVAAVPHDPLAYPECFPDPTAPQCQEVFPKPSFLQTSRSDAHVALLRYYDDYGDNGPSTLYRPFIQQEASYTLNTNAGTTDFAYGIAIDPSPRIRCLAQIAVPTTDPSYQPQAQACARIPARIFAASRGPASLIIGQVGQPPSPGASYNADFVTFTDTIPMPPGPSAVKIAPVVDQAGNYALRVFIVCFDSNQIIDYDPDQQLIEAVINVGLGPFALTFDPFDYTAAALGKHVDVDPRDADIGLKKYRFAYVGSFTQSYMQVIDLDNSTPDKNTWTTVFYNVGVPTPPKGS